MSVQLASIQSLIIDIDGVLWRGDKALPGVAEFFSFLQSHRIGFVVVTNNATRTPESLLARLASLSVGVSPTQILTSAKAAALYLRQRLQTGSRVLVVGEDGLLDALRREGFAAEPADIDDPGPSNAVVVGLDRGFTYRKLQGASKAIRSGAFFVATNTDTTIPSDNELLPGAGAIVAAVQTAASATPTVIGKPYRPMFDAALELLQAPRDRTAMLGDRLDTDIQGAKDIGLATILVMTGVTTPEEARASSLKSDFSCSDLVELRERWEAELSRVKS
jgi:4-nitrophenyl phosphatase